MEEAAKTLNLNEEIELFDSNTLYTKWEPNPLCAENEIVKDKTIYYVDSNDKPFRKKFLDIYYDEVIGL